jgi:hypothetical protein
MTQPRVSIGDGVAAVPLLAYLVLGLNGDSHRHPFTQFVGLLIGCGVMLAFTAVSYGTLLVALDDLLSWRRSPELTRWLTRSLAVACGCALFAGELVGLWRWVDR